MQIIKLIFTNLIVTIIFILGLNQSLFVFWGQWGYGPLISNQVIIIFLNILFIIMWVFINLRIIKGIRFIKLGRSLLKYIQDNIKKTRIWVSIIAFSLIIISSATWVTLHNIPVYSKEQLRQYSTKDWDEMSHIKKYSIALSFYIYAKSYAIDDHGHCGRKQFAHNYITILNKRNRDCSNIYTYVMSSISGYGA